MTMKGDGAKDLAFQLKNAIETVHQAGSDRVSVFKIFWGRTIVIRFVRPFIHLFVCPDYLHITGHYFF